MKKRTIECGLVGLGIVGAFLLKSLALEKEKPSQNAEAKVAQVIKATFPEALIGNMGKATEDGVAVIGVAFIWKGSNVEADVTPDGVLVGTEEATELAFFGSDRRDYRQVETS